MEPEGDKVNPRESTYEGNISVPALMKIQTIFTVGLECGEIVNPPVGSALETPRRTPLSACPPIFA